MKVLQPEDAFRAHQAIEDHLAKLRSEAAQIMALIDTRELPPPTRLLNRNGWNGPIWEVGRLARRWSVRVQTEEKEVPEPGGTCVYFSTPWLWGGEVESVPIEDARKLAMSILAACADADRGRRPAIEVHYGPEDLDGGPGYPEGWAGRGEGSP